jgi:hypothetical protein
VVKRAPAYRTIRPRIAEPTPVDAWQEGDAHYFVFELQPGAEVADEPPVALFVVNEKGPALTAAVVVSVDVGREYARVQEIQRPEVIHTLPLHDYGPHDYGPHDSGPHDSGLHE